MLITEDDKLSKVNNNLKKLQKFRRKFREVHENFDNMCGK